jgi:transcriptional regulator with AAA-type ATPase domain
MFDKEKYVLTEGARAGLLLVAGQLDGNAREMRNAVQRAILNHNSRVVRIPVEEYTRELLTTVTPEDLEFGTKRRNQERE